MVTTVASISLASGCDSQITNDATLNSLQSIQVDTDQGYLSHNSIINLIQDFKNNYDGNVVDTLPELPNGNFRVRTQWATYKYLDTDCGWDLYKKTVSMKQLLIQITDDKFLIYPSVFMLKGEKTKNAPYLKIVPIDQ